MDARLTGQTLADAEAIAAQVRHVGRLGVAYSGGVDSAVLLAVAAQALGDGAVIGLMGVSPSLAEDERLIAHAVAAQIGVPVIEFATREGDKAEYRANGVDRCYHCKDELFTRISTDLVADHDIDAVAYGENADDVARLDRPGAKAATEHDVLRPLAAAGVGKERVRAIARALELSVADKPAAPCLASRIPHGHEVTPEKLGQIEAAEQALRSLGFSDCRVRHHDEIARIEVPLAEWGRFADEDVRRSALSAIRAAGFRHVTIDLAGMQSGAFTLQIVGRNGHS